MYAEYSGHVVLKNYFINYFSNYFVNLSSSTDNIFVFFNWTVGKCCDFLKDVNWLNMW